MNRLKIVDSLSDSPLAKAMRAPVRDAAGFRLTSTVAGMCRKHGSRAVPLGDISDTILRWSGPMGLTGSLKEQ